MLQEADVATPLLPSRADSDGTLRRIYEEALRGFAVRGYHGVSVRDIADACGIKASSIYAHVPSKERLLYDLILIAHEEHREMLRDALLGAGSDPAEQLRALVAAHVRFHATYSMLATVGNNELHALAEENASVIQRIRDEDLRVFVDVIERGVKLGRFNCADPFIATAIIGSAGIRVAVWVPVASASALYPMAAGYTVDQIAASYAEFALKLVS